MSESIKALLLDAPAHHLDPSMVEKVRQWPDEPTALQVLEVLDLCVYSALASGLVIKCLELAFVEALKHEGVTRESVVAMADTLWRNLN